MMFKEKEQVEEYVNKIKIHMYITKEYFKCILPVNVLHNSLKLDMYI